MAHSIGLEVVAEGVESEALWDQLHLLNGCRSGLYISEPFPAEQFVISAKAEIRSIGSYGFPPARE